MLTMRKANVNLIKFIRALLLTVAVRYILANIKNASENGFVTTEEGLSFFAEEERKRKEEADRIFQEAEKKRQEDATRKHMN